MITAVVPLVVLTLLLLFGVALCATGARQLTRPAQAFRRGLEDQARVPGLARINPFRLHALQPIGVAFTWLGALVGSILGMLLVCMALLGFYWMIFGM